MIIGAPIPVVGFQIDGVEFWGEDGDNGPPGEAFAVWRTTRARRVLQNNVRPALENGL